MFLLLLVSPVYAQDTTVDITELPAQLAAQLGITEFIAGLIISVVFICLTLLPVIVATKGKADFFGMYLLLGILVLSVLVALGWLPVWIFILIIIALAIGLARSLSDAIGGGLRR